MYIFINTFIYLHIYLHQNNDVPHILKKVGILFVYLTTCMCQCVYHTEQAFEYKDIPLKYTSVNVL